MNKRYEYGTEVKSIITKQDRKDLLASYLAGVYARIKEDDRIARYLFEPLRNKKIKRLTHTHTIYRI